jgi:glutathione S-transferase
MMLYDTRVAPNPRRVRMFLAEKGLEVPTTQVDLGRLEQKTEAFRALNPSLQTPVLILDDGTALSESIAICRYFEELHPTPALFGVGALERALVEMWQRRVEFGLLLSVQHVFRHTHPAMAAMEPVQIKDIADLYRPRVLTFLTTLDAELKGRAFVAGDAFSVADITAFVSVEFMKRARIEAPAELTHLADWRARVAARPSAAA